MDLRRHVGNVPNGWTAHSYQGSSRRWLYPSPNYDPEGQSAGPRGGGGGGYGPAVGEAVTAVGAVHGFPAVRTSFVGRVGPVRELAVLL